MALRSFLHLSNNINKCIFTIVQLKPKSYVAQEYAQIRNFRKLTNRENVHRHKYKIGSKIWKPLAFTVVFSGTTFISAAIWEYENIRNRTYKLIRNYKQWRIQQTGWRYKIKTWWNALPEGHKIFAPICFLNIMGFLLWRIPAFHVTMKRYFCNGPASSSLCWPLLLSTFSHSSILHLLLNMYALYTFSGSAVHKLGKEQFVLLYLCSGVLSGFTSHLYKVIMGFQTYSLGASGAIMGIVGYTCTEFDDMKLYFILLPFNAFSASTALKTLMGIDVMGCLFKWKHFDHAAHLGGALTGIFWHFWGSANIWQKREPVLTFWHQLRERSRSQ